MSQDPIKEAVVKNLAKRVLIKEAVALFKSLRKSSPLGLFSNSISRPLKSTSIASTKRALPPKGNYSRNNFKANSNKPVPYIPEKRPLKRMARARAEASLAREQASGLVRPSEVHLEPTYRFYKSAVLKKLAKVLEGRKKVCYWKNGKRMCWYPDDPESKKQDKKE